jgi:hypothetical protein
MRNIFMLIAAALLLAPPAAAAAQESHGEWDMDVAQLRAAVERMRTEMFRPGDRVAGWNRGGADPDADLRAAGADSHYYRIRRSGGDAIVILTARPLAGFAPAGWRVADTYGEAAARAGNPFVQFEALSPRYVIGMRGDSERRGDTDCVGGVVNATLYERSDVPATAADAQIPLFFRLMLLATEDQIVCTRYEGNAREGWRGIAFLPDGRALPALNDGDDHIEIVPAGPIERLVTHRETDGGT